MLEACYQTIHGSGSDTVAPQALATDSLVETRARFVDKLIQSCAVPENMKLFYVGQDQPAH